MKQPSLRKGDTIARWTLVSWLGSGGNAEVWRAQDAEVTMAVKVLFTKKPDSEPYQRFRREVDFMRQMGSFPGVLPLHDAHVPERPTKENRAWLAMPVAQGVKEALEGEPLETVVDACARFAEVLAALVAEHRAAHRDLKPGNLYRWEKEWCVGDFGLVDLPDEDSITAEGRTIGPLYFLAPEVLHRIEPVDYNAADVWSLAKTLWVLCVDQDWPDLGEQPADRVGRRVQDLAPHPRAAALDRLIENCTITEPTARPTMAEVARELRAWLQAPPAPPGVLDLSAQGAALRQRLSGELLTRELAERRREQAEAARHHFLDRLEPVHDAIEQQWPAAELEVYDDFTESWLSAPDAAGLPEVDSSEFAADKIVVGNSYVPIVFRVGYGTELFSTGEIRFSAFIEYGREGETGGDQSAVIEARAPVGTVQAEQAATEVVARLRAELPGWLDRFVQALPPR